MKKCMFMICAMVLATPMTSVWAGDMRFPVRFTYLNGINDIADWHDDNVPNSEVDVASPVGLSFAPYFECGSGLQIWGDIGPAIVMIGDVDYWSVPLSLGVGFTFASSHQVAPYLKAGIRYPLADGDYVDGSSVGPIVAAGIEFLRWKKMGIVAEVGYDASSITLIRSGPDEEEIEGGVTASLGIVF